MNGKIKFEFFGNAAYRITNREGTVILVDPFLDGSDCSPIGVKDLDRVDLILVTHAAWDHMGNTLEIARKFNCTVVCGGEVRHHLGDLPGGRPLHRTGAPIPLRALGGALPADRKLRGGRPRPADHRLPRPP